MFSSLKLHILVVCIGTYAAYLEGKIIDLSHVYDETTIYLKGQQRLKVTVTHNSTEDGYKPTDDIWLHLENICTATHGGTHMDAPCVKIPDGWCISDIPVERLILPAVVIDISDKVKDNPEINLETEDILKWEEKHGAIPDGSLVLIRTGWSRFWPDMLNYTGSEVGDSYKSKFPEIEAEAAKYIAENRTVYGIGIDTLSLSYPHNNNIDSHVVLLKQNIYALENLNNLDLLPVTGATVYSMPMKLSGAGGAPCRVIAQLP